MWADGCFVSAISVFGVDGRIHICTINCPGSWHDSYNSDYTGMIVVNSAFEIKQSNAMIKTSQEDPSVVPELLLINNDAYDTRPISLQRKKTKFLIHLCTARRIIMGAVNYRHKKQI